MKKKNTIPDVSDAVVMVAFRRAVKDPNLLKKLSRRQPKMVKELFDMADQYANQEDAMAAEMMIGHARRKGRTSPSPPNQKIASARVMTWSR